MASSLPILGLLDITESVTVGHVEQEYDQGGMKRHSAPRALLSGVDSWFIQTNPTERLISPCMRPLSSISAHGTKCGNRNSHFLGSPKTLMCSAQSHLHARCTALNPHLRVTTTADNDYQYLNRGVISWVVDGGDKGNWGGGVGKTGICRT